MAILESVPVWFIDELRPVIVVNVRLVMLSKVPELLKVVTPEKVAVEEAVADMVPSLVSVVIADSVAVVGSVKVAPELLVKVVGLKFRVEPDAKFIAPELVNVPPVTATVPVD